MENKLLRFSPEVAKALQDSRPVVALESTIIAHGMPYPKNTATARDMAEVEALRPRLRTENLFAVLRISAEEKPRFLPSRDGAYLSDRVRRALGVVAD